MKEVEIQGDIEKLFGSVNSLRGAETIELDAYKNPCRRKI